MATTSEPAISTVPRTQTGVRVWIRRNKMIVGGTLILLALVALAILAPWIADDPIQFEPTNRLK